VATPGGARAWPDGNDRVIDLCTGTADLAMAALKARPTGAQQVVGIDFSAEMLRVGQRKVRAAALEGRVPLVRGDAVRLPLGSASADAVMIAFGIRNVVDPLEACREIQRVLRPGVDWRCSSLRCRQRP